MTNTLYYDPYDRGIAEQPYPLYARMRDEAPLYYNEEHDFYAVTRHADVKAGLADHHAFSSARGDILEMIKQDAPMPPGTFICEDPPMHSIHRAIVQRIFAPRRMVGIDDRIRTITQQIFDRLNGRESFDFIADLGAQIPMHVIGVLLGIPEAYFEEVRDSVDSRLITQDGKPMQIGGDMAMQLDEGFGRFIDWRIENPADDIITELLNVDLTDTDGQQRKLSKDELLTFINILAGAGNETTNKVIGWMGKVLAEHPDQRRELVADPRLIPAALDELLRYEPPGPHIARYCTRDTEIAGGVVPAGSAILLVTASANRDPRVFDQPDVFNIHRNAAAHLTFGHGIHTCIGSVLARKEAHIVCAELLKRFPQWDVELEHARLLATSTVRGWETLPAYTSALGKQQIHERIRAAAAADAAPNAAAPASLDGEWTVTVKGPTGPMDSHFSIATQDGVMQGVQSGDGAVNEVDQIDYDSDTGSITWINKIRKPMKMTLTFSGKVDGDKMDGKVKAGFMGSYPFVAVKQSS